MFLRLAETLTEFLTRLRNSADTLDVIERQRIVRLVVKDVLIGDDSLVIRHCIPIVAPSPSGDTPSAAGNRGGTPNSPNYLLRKGSAVTAVVQYSTHGPGPGVGIAWLGILPIRRRLQHLCTQPSGGRKSDERDQGLSREDLAPANQLGQKRGGAALGTKVPWV